ncbi:MAG TPA: hypothetical protein VJZ27_10470, partial [Aggregatilineales bacterium]|nr:hypothetical protein [Aggregatilineales bacterium]
IQIDDVDTTADAPKYVDDESGDGEFDSDFEIKARRPPEAYDESGEASRGSRIWNLVIFAALIILLGFAGFAAFRVITAEDTTPPASPTLSRGVLSAAEATGTAVAESSPATAQQTVQQPSTRTRTPRPTNTIEPATATNTLPPPTEFEIVPTIAPTLTPTQVITIVTNTPPPSFTPSPIPPTPTPPENVVDALRILNLIQPADYGWNPVFFSQGAGGIWQLGGSVEQVGSAPIAVIISPDFMDSTFRDDAGLRLRRVNVRMELTLFDAERIESGQVFFGIALQNQSRQRYGAQVQLRQIGVVSLGVNENGTFRGISQLPLSPVEVTFTLERTENETVMMLIDGQRLGESPRLFPLDEAVSIVLYNAGGGMFVTVSDLEIELAPQ